MPSFSRPVYCEALPFTSPLATVLLVCVARLHRAAAIGERDCAAQRVGDKTSRPQVIGAAKEFVDPEAGQHVRARRAAREFLHDIGAVVERVRRRAIDRLAGASSRGIVCKARCRRSRERDEPIT